MFHTCCRKIECCFTFKELISSGNQNESIEIPPKICCLCFRMMIVQTPRLWRTVFYRRPTLRLLLISPVKLQVVLFVSPLVSQNSSNRFTRVSSEHELYSFCILRSPQNNFVCRCSTFKRNIQNYSVKSRLVWTRWRTRFTAVNHP